MKKDIDINAIKECIEYQDFGHYGGTHLSAKAREQLAALVANQVPGRCKDCVYNDVCSSNIKNETNILPHHDHYCSYFTKREA